LRSARAGETPAGHESKKFFASFFQKRSAFLPSFADLSPDVIEPFAIGDWICWQANGN
jgi:hypothetical protein